MKARDLATWLRAAKVGTRHGDPTPKVRPAIRPQDRDLIVRALEEMADREVGERQPEQTGG